MRRRNKVAVLICGYARSGKDTLASGIIGASHGAVRRLSFADPLKEVCNVMMYELGFSGTEHNFFMEDYKVANRDFLVEVGRFARSKDKDVFARRLAFDIIDQRKDWVVVPDLRYANEVEVCKKHLVTAGWSVHVIKIATDGVIAANKEERESMKGLTNYIDRVHTYPAYASAEIIRDGQHLFRALYQNPSTLEVIE